ncbi:hypothetical protein [Actinoplanes sp. NPDC049681]|uniref:hypothetical protein n=1 Tax=Actinoplanes sp. NPDC049681 TaxID=3363905 RepID=UPI0037BB4CBE
MVEATAARRTGLLHRMLVVRRLEQRLMRAVPVGDEAVAIGLLSVLGPQDAVVSAGVRPWHAVGAAALLFGGDVTNAPDPAEAVAAARRKAGAGGCRIVAVCIPGDDLAGATLAPPACAGLPVLFCRGEHLVAAGRSPVVSVLSADSADVEAIAGAAATEVGELRTGAGPCLLGLRAPAADVDPVELLATRMRTDHQLDDNALRAIGRAAAARAEEVLERLGATRAP